MLIDCPECNAQVDGEIIGSVEMVKDPDDESEPTRRVSLLRCPVCGNPLVAMDVQLTMEDFLYWNRAERLWPSRLAFSSALPKDIRFSLEEAEKCRRAGAFTASVAMTGRGLEAMCRHFGTKSQVLAGGLKELLERDIIDKRIYSWGDERAKHRRKLTWNVMCGIFSMSVKTKSEKIFEHFLRANDIRFEQIEEAATPRPDYLVYMGDAQTIFEVKELAEDDKVFKSGGGFDATIGDFVRRRIERSKRQIQYGAKQGIPSVLLIYNNLDPGQMIGTDDVDFEAAMYGEFTISINKVTGVSSDLFHGRKQLLQAQKNQSFSAVGRLRDWGGETKVKLFENVYAEVPLPFEKVPRCLEMARMQIDSTPL